MVIKSLIWWKFDNYLVILCSLNDNHKTEELQSLPELQSWQYKHSNPAANIKYIVDLYLQA